MAVFWVSFRIENVRTNKGDYGQRYVSLIQAYEKLRGMYWEETTSFMVFESSRSIDTIVSELGKSLSLTHDLILVCAMDSKDARVTGLLKYNDIFKLLADSANTYLKKV